MARTPKDSDYIVPVEGIGNFTFARRRMADEINIQVEYARMLDGVTATPWLNLVATWITALAVLTVRAPDGWDIDELDPLENEDYAKLKRVYDALAEKERSFRRKPGKGREGAGAAPGEDGRVLVSPSVQPDQH